MADFNALNESRSRTLRQIREMVSEEAELWDQYFAGRNTSGMLADIDRSRARFQALWNRHEEVRRQMVDAGFMPPPFESDYLLDRLAEDPIQRKIEDRLKAEMEAARAEYYCASREFRLFVAHGTGMPAPDCTLRAR